MDRTCVSKNISDETRVWKTSNNKNLETEVSPWKRIKSVNVFFLFTIRRRNLKKQQSPIILYLCLKEIRLGTLHNFRYDVIFGKLSFKQKLFSVHMKTQIRRLQIPPVWKALLNICIFCDGLVWTAGLAAENKAASSSFTGVMWTLPRQAYYTTGSPRSLGTVNMTLRNSVIIKVCMGK